MTRHVLLDTGPLVALLNRRDRYHRWAAEQWAEIEPPLLTCEPVLTEACFIVRELPGGGAAVLEMLDRGVIRVPFRLERDPQGVRRLLERYANLPMSLADACLVRMLEEQADGRVLTLDRDFRVYRTPARRVIPVIMPAGL